jgi:hypothetical protein
VEVDRLSLSPGVQGSGTQTQDSWTVPDAPQPRLFENALQMARTLRAASGLAA